MVEVVTSILNFKTN